MAKYKKEIADFSQRIEDLLEDADERVGGGDRAFVLGIYKAVSLVLFDWAFNQGRFEERCFWKQEEGKQVRELEQEKAVRIELAATINKYRAKAKSAAAGGK